MSFERVGKAAGDRSGATTPLLAIYPNGGARFNAAAGREWLDDVEYVEFYVDRDDDRIGIARGGDADGAWRLQDDEPGYSVSFRGTLSKLGIDVDGLDASVHVELEHDHEVGLLIADAEPLFEEVNE